MINKFILQDYDSKFGTLKVIQQPFRIEPGVDTYVQVGCTVLQFKLETPVETKTTSCWAALCRCFKRGKIKDLHLRSYMKKTSNPDAPIKDEVKTLSKTSCNHATLKRGSLNNSSVSPAQSFNYDFMNYPEAIPEEVFVYFGSQVDSLEDLKKVT